MATRNIYLWAWQEPDVPVEQQIQEILSNDDSVNVYYLHQLEYAVHFSELMCNLILDNPDNILVKVTTFMATHKGLEKYIATQFNNKLPKNILVYPWWDYYFLRSEAKLRNNTYLKEKDSAVFDHPFLCYMHKPKLHRNLLIDKLAEYDLISKGIVTYWHDVWSTLDEKTTFNYYDGKPITRDNGYENGFTSWNFDLEFMTSFMHCVTESDCGEYTGITEKTATPIFAKRPFLVLGSVGFHSELENLGFKLYTELFDYSFDVVDDIEQRTQMYTDNIIQIVDNKDHLVAMFNKIKSKLDFNEELAWQLVKEKPNVPLPMLERLNDFALPFPQANEEEDAQIFTDWRIQKW